MPNKCPATIWTNANLVHMCIYHDLAPNGQQTITATKTSVGNTCPITDVPYMFYTKVHSPGQIFYSPGSKCTLIGEWARFSFHWIVTQFIPDYCDVKNDISSISCKSVPWWTLKDPPDGKSTLVQVMTWCRQTTSHYLNQCWPSSMLPCIITRPQWVNEM